MSLTGLPLAESLLESVGSDVLEVMRVHRGRASAGGRGSGSGLSVGSSRHGTCPGVSSSSHRLGARWKHHHGPGPTVGAPGRPAAAAACGRRTTRLVPRYGRRRFVRILRCGREPPRAAMLSCRFGCCRALREREASANAALLIRSSSGPGTGEGSFFLGGNWGTARA